MARIAAGVHRTAAAGMNKKLLSARKARQQRMLTDRLIELGLESVECVDRALKRLIFFNYNNT